MVGGGLVGMFVGGRVVADAADVVSVMGAAASVGSA
jgi:hypothetical protein